MRNCLSSSPATLQRGLTLIEAMITLAIAAILLTWAVPSLQDFIIRNRMSTEVNNFIAALYVARSESVKRMRDVRLCPSTNGTGCTTGSAWHQGWIIFVDNGGTTTVIQQYPSSDFQISGRADIVFKPNGQSPGSNDTFVFCDSSGVANTRNVILSNAGRVRTEKLPTSGGCGS